MKKLVLSLLFAASIIGVKAQTKKDESNKWIISAGVNAVDMRTPATFGELMKDYIGTSDLNIAGIPAIINIERSLNKSFAIQLGASFNNIEKPFGWNGQKSTMTDLAFMAFDGKLKFDLNTLIGETAFFDPFVSLGGGYSKIGDNGDVKLNAGYGANLWFTETLGLKLESTYNHAFNHDGTDFFQHSVGLAYKIFVRKDTDKDGVKDDEDACPEVAGLPEFKGCPDTDGDGIKDSDDACPKVKGLKELNGCPDEDGDGVKDSDDGCPKVDGPKENKGCPWPDTDGDGITDNIDKCPKVSGIEAEGGCPKPEPVAVTAPVKADPCAAEMSEISSTEIYFDLNKSYIKSSERVKLDRVVEVIKSMQCQVELLFLSGFADPTGPEAYNLGLSKRRAQAVHKYLTKKGVTNITVQDEGMGETNTREDNTFNRRVEIKIN